MRNTIKLAALVVLINLISSAFMTSMPKAGAINNTPTATPNKKILLEEVSLPFLRDTFSLSWVKWNPQNGRVAIAYTASVDVTIYDAATGNTQFKLKKPGPVRIQEGVSKLSWSPNGNLLAIGIEDDAIFVWNITQIPPIIIATIPQSGSITQVNWSPDSQKIAFMDGHEEPKLSIWDLTANKVVEVLPEEARLLAWSPNGKQIAILKAGQDGEILDSQTRNVKFILPRMTKDNFILNHISVSWSPDSQRLIGVDCNATSSDCIVWFQDLIASELILGSNSETTILGTTELVWRYLGDLVATNSGRNIVNIWDPKTGTLLATIDSYDTRVTSLDWSCDGQMLATVSAGGALRIWKIRIIDEF